MRKANNGATWAVLSILVFFPALATGQQADPEDAVIEEIRALQTISPLDQRRINEWIQSQVDKLAGQPADSKSLARAAFVDRLEAQAPNPKNSPAFRLQLATQCAQIAATEFAKPKVDSAVAWGLARVLVNLDVAETYPGLLAGIACPIQIVRYLCARGLTIQRDAIAKDKPKSTEVLQAVQSAASAETSPVVLAHLYRAISFPVPSGESIHVFLAIFDKRLAYRRESGRAADGAELEAVEYFRTPSVAGAIDSNVKTQLLQRLAVFLRLDAERYNVELLAPTEIAKLELLLEAVEGALQVLTAGKTTPIADELGKGGRANRAEVLNQAYRLIGHPTTKEPGMLNAAPWNVPIGAP